MVVFAWFFWHWGQVGPYFWRMAIFRFFEGSLVLALDRAPAVPVSECKVENILLDFLGKGLYLYWFILNDELILLDL